ncbi:MAG: hypothetical protein H7Y20_12525 [Bryobacteraceae bacterium]|nr:hypothetical protein [Bryobacteraceae bacterium]
MVVRIRLKLAYPSVKGVSGALTPSRQSALALASLMTPVAFMAWALGMWRIASDLKLAASFAISEGMFSHWQVWFAVGIAVQFAAFLLHRYAGRGQQADDAAFL